MKRLAVGILAHVDSGKTTLTEAMLYCSGNIKKLGRVDHRDSFLDTFALERDRGITIFSKQAVLNYQDTVFTILDTPGHMDFSAEAERTLQVLDYAILVVSGTDGVQSHTRTLWKLLRKYRVPCFIFVNKMDMDGADRDTVMADLHRTLSDSCVDFGCPDRDTLYENIALCGEALLQEYTDSGTISPAAVTAAIQERRLYPCMFGSALKLQGIDSFLECLDKYTTAPVYGDDFAAKVYKISEDTQKNRLTFMKITGGCLRVRDVLPGDRNTAGEKVTQIRVYSGEKFTAADTAPAGTVCAVTGITFARPGDGLGAESSLGMPVLEPVLTYSVILPDDVDSHTALQKFRILEAEDPMLNVGWDERSGEIQVRLMGDIQLEILSAIVAERFGFAVQFGRGSIIYKETITDTVEGVGHFEPLRHYAEVHLILKPAPRDSGLVFNTACREDLLDKNWQRLILTHLYEKTHVGVLTGSPITDMEITLVSGKAHEKHTEGGDFRQATYRAVRQGLRSAHSVLLEPVYDFTLEIPAENIGRALSDIQRMHGAAEPPDIRGEIAVITGTAPVAAMRDYAAAVVQYTRGRGRLSCAVKGYDICHDPDAVIAACGYLPDADTDNPCDSVFCSHGAGHTVKWDEVKSHMHLSSALQQRDTSPAPRREQLLARAGSQKELFASDKELMRIFEQTYGPIKPRVAPIAPRAYKTEPKAPKHRKPITKPTKEYVLVDGYNLIFSWENLKALAEDNIDAARNVLINTLSNYRGYRKCELILVFDAYKVRGSDREVEQTGGISIVYTKEAETADTYIEKTSHALARDNRVRVVTSDRLEQLIIVGNGAVRVSCQEFREEIDRAEQEIRAIINGNGPVLSSPHS